MQMWLLLLAAALQGAVLFELVLNRVIAVLCNSRRSDVRKFADGSVCGSLLGLVVSALTIPVSVAAAAAQLFLSYFMFWVGLLLAIAILAALSETSSPLLQLYVNAYNAGVGQTLNELLVLLFELVAPFWRAVVPVYNAAVYVVVGFWVDVVLPVVFVNARLLPALVLDFTVLVGGVALGTRDWLARVGLCAQTGALGDLLRDNATSPFWVSDLSCVGSPHYMTLDMMTPALYAQRSATTLQQMLTTTCVPVSNALALAMYPLLDVNLYKALHGLVNAVLHTLVALPLLTRNRCTYALATTDYAYSASEKLVMCTPDVAPLAAVLVSALRSTGTLADNWLDTALVLAENSVTGVVRSCAATPLPLVWANASGVFGADALHVVGLTPSVYAITDADSVVYHSMVGASLRVAYALHAWPFRVDLRFGVAAVRYGAVNDVDDEGDARTGMLGCRCLDTAAGLQITCASIPFQHHLADDEDQHLDYTVHQMRFVPESARAGLTCAQVSVRVQPLRFSRRRFSAPGAGRVELGLGDAFNTRLQYGARAAADHSADAAVVVTPLCAVRASVLCVPSIENCFPFCLGLHAAGQRSQNISLMNAQRWDEWTSLGQTDCVVANAAGGSCTADSTRLVQNADAGVEVSGCASTACAPDAASVTFVKNSEQAAANRSLQAWQAQQPWGFVRSALQPFVVAGDVFLYQREIDAVSGQVLVTRLYDNKRGDFSLQQEQLSLVTNSVPMQYHQCADEACYAAQLSANRVVLPAGYFVREDPTHAAASEWGVHWTAAPGSAHCALIHDFCAQTSGRALVTTEAHRPRLWTVRTVRHAESLGAAVSEEALASYMLIPEWFSCSHADFREEAQCGVAANLQVAGLEYINADNLLLTVLAARPGDWDWQTERVFPGRPFEYRFYFVHPNRHDCTSAEAPETLYTCWRSADDGMFVAASTVAETGALCPMLQRMPKWGSMGTEVLVAQVLLAKVVLEAVFVLPLVVRGSIGDLFERRAAPTFHSVLDASGATLFELEDALQAMQLAAFYAAGTVARTGALMQSLGVQELETVLVGTARIFEHTQAASSVEDAVFGPAAAAVSGPYSRLVSGFGASTSEAAPLATPGAPVSLSGQGSSRFVKVFAAIAGPSMSYVRITVKVMRRVLIKALRNGQLVRLVARDMASTLLTSVYESDSEISHGLFDNMKVICDASGQVVGRTNAWGQAVRHACMTVPESMQAVVKVILVLAVDYQVMDCVCRQTDGFVVEDVLQNVCLPRILPMARKAFVMQAAAAKSTSPCFAVMDAVNDQLLRAFEPLFARMVKAQRAIESAFGLLITQALGVDALAMKCTELDSPFVVSIMPEPVDYFMGCMQTFECRARCLDSMQAFDDSLRAYTAYSPAPLAYVSTADVETESRFFSYADMEAGRHLAPFAVFVVVQLPPSVCLSVCPTQQARCVAVAGMRLGAIAAAYYCVPASLVMSVYEGVPLPASAAAYSAEPLRARAVLDMQFASVHKRAGGSAEWLVVLARDSKTRETSVWVVPGGVPAAAWRVLETRTYDPLTATSSADPNDPAWPAETIRAVHVLPAHAARATASVFVLGTTRADDGQADVSFCVYVRVDTGADGAAVDLTRRACRSPPAAVHSETHRTVCLDYDCGRVVRVPVDGGTEVRLETLAAFDVDGSFDWSVNASRTVHVPQEERKLLDIDSAALLSAAQDGSLLVTRRTLSQFGAVSRGAFDAQFGADVGAVALTIDVPLTGRGEVGDAWLQNVRLRLGAGAANLRVSASFTTAQKAQTVVNCSVTSCAGCHGAHPLQVDLQNKCFAAASCGIAQCVGTPVNMKRPLCQVSALLGQQIAFVRVNMQSFWDFFSRSIITVVELTQSRRQLYEVSTAQETTMATVCSAKDGIVQTFAIFGSLYAQVPALALDDASREPLSLQELRYNTERVMVATAVVEFLSQIGLFVVYVPLVSAKVMQCQLNDAFLVIEGVVRQGALVLEGAPTDVVRFRMGSAKFDTVDDFAVGMCLTDRFKQDMRDIADPAREQSMLAGLQDVIDGITGLATTEKIGWLAMALDALCAWVLGMLAGTMNLMQVVDSAHCRPPALDALGVGSCVCGDVPARVPDAQRSSTHTDALWCRGPLLMRGVLANDLLVWNPYSLAELLAQNQVQAYFDCLATARGDQGLCARQRPANALFDAQGVDVLQVIIRCRSNYQQKRWDEGAVALGLLERASDWEPGAVRDAALAQMYAQAGVSFQTLRKRLAQISHAVDGMRDLADDTHACLRAALLASDWNHNCAELALASGLFPQADSLLSYFVYGAHELNGMLRPDAALFENADACESFSGSISGRSSKGVAYPLMAWDGDSKNTVAVAEMHNKRQGSAAERVQLADAQLLELVRTKIAPAFAVALADVDTEFWALEGDALHQGVDCVVLGPYAAADMLPAHKTLRDSFRTQQYHRGSPQSREILYGLRTQGSPARQRIMGEVVAHVERSKDEKLRELVRGVEQALRKAYTQPANLYCTCPGSAPPSVACCVSNAAMHTDLAHFGATFSAQSVLPALQDLHGAFTASMLDEASEARVLEEMWFAETFEVDAGFSAAERQVLANDFAFAYDAPVREYSANEAPQYMHSTLWTHCVRSLDSVFFTMPLRVASDGSATVDADTGFDPATSSAAEAGQYMHGMERAVETILAKARLHAPTYWSHGHRYMPSDSVWCEETRMRAAPTRRNATLPPLWNDLPVSGDGVAAPRADEVLYVGRLGATCACGLPLAGGRCAVPPGVCERNSSASANARWGALCAAGTYAAARDGLLVRLALSENNDLLRDCDEAAPSTTWGLLDSAQQRQWYDGSQDAQNVSLHEVAAHGPAGVRLAMLLGEHEAADAAWRLPRAPAADLADAYNAKLEHTVAQPFCRSTQDALFTAELGEYFRDVLFPMAHAVHEPPSQVVCARWVVEYALFVAVLNITGATSFATAEQRLVEERWRSRCLYQLEVVGICRLRNVYSLVPPGTQNASHCKFTLAPGACSKFYVTDACLLMCDGQVYDPCLCAGAVACAVVFDKSTCATGVRYMPLNSDVTLASLHWPTDAWPPDAAQQSALNALAADARPPRVTLADGLFGFLRDHAARPEGESPAAFCDDLLDYMDPHAQHPVGYHPTCACDRRETNMRGFDAWMSTGSAAHAYSHDPVRMRNMSQYSTTFGAAHLTCDAAAYGAGGAQLNTLRMQSKWNPNARADAAVPVFADRSAEATMADAAAADAADDTPLQASASSRAAFAHSVGLVRDWLRDYESDADQAALDSLWPHWLDTPDARAETFSAPSADALHASCSLPPLLRCYEDSDCSSSSAALRCRFNLGDAYGLCVRLDTCFQHAHCAGGLLCSGTGFCEQPQVVVHNTLATPIDVRISARKSRQCTGSAYGASVFQHVPTFARDNGLCSVSNLFNYRNLTHDAPAEPGREHIKAVAGRNARFIPDAASLLALADPDSSNARNALKMQAHACDRDYEHTDFGVCLPAAMPLDPLLSDDVPFFASTRTWRDTDAQLRVDFCNLRVGSGAFGALTSPYADFDELGEATDSLRHAATTIKRCNEFTFCPAPIDTVAGKLVARLVWEAGVLAKYPLRYAGQCMAFGVIDGARCRVDPLVVPLVSVLFEGATTVPALDAPFARLRAECPDAFGAAREDALQRFQSTFVLLSQPYSPANALVAYDPAACERMADRSVSCVADTINTLALRIFDATRPSDRGITDIAQYMRRARCVTHVFRQLQAAQLANAIAMAPFGVPPEEAPGAALFMFTGHFPVEVPLSWLWQCVLIATPADGGAQADWYTVLTDPAAEDSLVCPNLDRDTPAADTLREHLQRQPDVYSSDGGSAVGADVYDALLAVMRDAVDKWDVTSIPTLVCRAKNVNELAAACADGKQYDARDKACWLRLPSVDGDALSYHQDTLTGCSGSDKRCTLYDVMFQFIFGRSGAKLRENTVLTVDWMLEQKVALKMDLDTPISPSFSYANLIPEIVLARLYDLNASLIHSTRPQDYEVDYPGRAACGGQGDEPLPHAEYQITRRIIDALVGSGEGEFRIYRRIFGFEEMALARAKANREVYEYYDIAEPSGASARFVAISQKQMLLLALYYLRQTMYDGLAHTFGTMRFVADVRVLMQTERVAARGLARRVADARLYDSVVNKQNFLCPEGKQIAAAQESDLQRQLRACLRDLKVDVGWTVAPGQTLVARADADVLLSGFYVSFAARPGEAFLDELVNTDWHLRAASPATGLCFSTPGGAAPLGPLWSGTLDLQSCPQGRSCGCQLASAEASTFVDLTCDQSTDIRSCEREFPAFVENVQRAMYDRCWQTQGDVVSVGSYEQMQGGSLCSRQPAAAEQCRAPFGAQGGVRGLAQADLHRRTPVGSEQLGLFAPNSTLFRGERADDATRVTALRLLATDIGGHSVRLLARAVGSAASRSAVLDVACVSAGRSCAEVPFSTWLSTVAAAWAVQHDAHTARHNLERYAPDAQGGRAHWRCPLQWVGALADRTVAYAARSPSADRNRVRFHHITGDSSYAHATVVETTRVAQHPARFLADRSACVDAELADGVVRFRCRGRTLLLDALDTHRGRWATTRFVAGGTANCQSILDWPHVYSRTVDGDTRAEPQASSYCNVFWRLPSFALRYVATAAPPPDKPAAARAPGSACHMGRLKRTALAPTDATQFCTRDDARSRCRMLRRNDTAGAEKYSWYEHDVAFDAPFAATRRPARRERRCAACDRHDTASFVDRRTRETPLSNAVPQLSVGQPTTVSTERLLAAALRRHACPNGPSAPCPDQYAVFNESTWRRGRLLEAMLALARAHQQTDPPPPSDAALWDAPWVRCDRVHNVTTCSGRVSKAEWTDPATRVGACLREMRGAASPAPSSLDFCQLSDETAALCAKVVDWNAEITRILCTAGNHAKCTARAFYYNPSQYAASNKDFVYNTVASLYTKLNSSACPREAQLQSESNAQKVKLCASTYLEPLVLVVKLVRSVLRKLAMLAYYVVEALFAVCGVVVSQLSAVPGATAAFFADNLEKYVHLVLTVGAQALEQIWQIAWTLTDFGPLKFLRTVVLWLCYLTQYVIQPIIQSLVVPWMTAIAAFLGGLNDAICTFSFGKVCQLVPVQPLEQFTASLRQSKPMQCADSSARAAATPSDTLPVATRCWATYNTFYGDSGRLSCSAADTCRRGPTDFALVMCGACASVEENMPFGCWDVTKTCTCNLPLLAEQGCSANEECLALDATCRFVDRELQPSVGFTKCASCQTRRVCLLTPGRSTGFCACGLVELELQRCVAQSRPAMPAYDKLCVYTQDAAFLRTTSFVFSFYTSMTAPCNDLNPAATYCARESSDGELYAVGVDAVQGRRLLGAAPAAEAMTAADTHNSLCQDALAGDAMPAHRRACRAAHALSVETVALLALPWPLAPCTFCSVEDAVHGLLLQPQNLVMLASNASRVAQVVLRHSPLRVLAESARHVRRHITTAVQIAAAEPAVRVEHANGTWVVVALVDSPSVDMLATLLGAALWAFADGADADGAGSADERGAGARRLLSMDDAAEAIQQTFRVSASLRAAFAAQLASTLDFTFESPAAQREWLGSWPPKLGAAALAGDVCPPLANMMRTTRRALETVDAAYSMQQQAVPAADVSGAWVNISRRDGVSVSWADYSATRASHDPITAAALVAADRALAVAGLSPSAIFDVLAAGADELWHFVRCDYEAVQTCSKWRAHVLVAGVVVGVYYVGVYAVCAAVGLGMPALLAAAALPSIVLYVAYGYAPLCFPAVPVCLYDDLVYSLQQLAPASIRLPSVLYRSERCLAAAGPRVDAACLRTCTDEPFSFLEWYDVLAWWALELGLEARLADLARGALAASVLGPQAQDDVLAAVAFHTRVFETPDGPLLAANRACAVLSLYKILPHLALLFLALMLALAAVQILLQTASVALQTAFALLVSAFY